MTASVQSVEAVCNIALQLIGYPQRLRDIFEGSKASKIALDLYAETRDETLRERNWGFANRAVTLPLLKSAPSSGYSSSAPWANTYPPIPWAYEYAYPADCIRLLYVYSGQTAFPNNDPLPVQYKTANDNAYSPPQRVILSNQANAVGVYTGQVTDMTTWEPLFTRTMTHALAQRFAAALAQGQALIELRKQEAQSEMESAAESEAREET